MALNQEKLLVRLLAATRSLSAMVDLETYLQSVLSAAIELTQSETASLMEYDEAKREFRFKFIPWLHREALKDSKVPLQGSIAGQVFLRGKPIAIDNVQAAPQHYEKIDLLASFQTRSILGVPLILHGRPIGVFEAFNKPSAYTKEDILILETLASLAATAIQNDQLEKQIQFSQSETRNLEKLKNEFVAITSHELRTPLGLILGHSTFLREMVGDEHHEQVDTIIRNAARLKEIIESLSNMDNQQSGNATLRLNRVSLARIIDDVASSFSDMARQNNIDLKVEKPAGQELLVGADGNKVAIALSNIVKNALTFSVEGGRVFIRATAQPDSTLVIVEDNGIGIPAKDIPHVFDRFYQVESHLTRKHGGMGLGLSVAKAMIEMHKGKIWIESKEGAGVKVYFTLPSLTIPPAALASPFAK